MKAHTVEWMAEVHLHGCPDHPDRPCFLDADHPAARRRDLLPEVIRDLRRQAGKGPEWARYRAMADQLAAEEEA